MLQQKDERGEGLMLLERILSQKKFALDIVSYIQLVPVVTWELKSDK